MVSGVRLNKSNYKRSNLASKVFADDDVTKICFYGLETVAPTPILSWSNADVIRFLQTHCR